MIEEVKAAIGFIRKLEEGGLAKLAAYLLAPGFVFGLAVSAVYSPSVGLDFGRPVTMVDLHTEVDVSGEITGKSGMMLILEPVELEYRIPLNAGSSVWMSLDQRTARMNNDRLVLTPTELRGKSPLIGVSTPVTLVVTGEPEGEIWLPGGKEQLEDWRSEPRRSIAFVSNVLLVCVFAFGISLAAVLPLSDRVQDAGAEIRTKPDHS
jgi:hypothetical protein